MSAISTALRDSDASYLDEGSSSKCQLRRAVNYPENKVRSVSYTETFWSRNLFSFFNLPVPVSDRWIVVTSINYPTEDVKRLASLTDWNLVVVGDRKTPPDWQLDSVHYLSMEIQEKLGFRMSSVLPENSYTRKNIGYLYAIQRGAMWIYDTDDDNKPYGKGLEQFDFSEYISALCFTKHSDSNEIQSKLFNPYRFFGHPHMWPRGFPLEHLKNHTNGNARLRLCHSTKIPVVQQGLVQKDPDVDAIYRLLHADKKTGLDERFNEFAPPVILSPGTYSPWNSQNTLFHRNAFFTMYLPVSVEFRVTDIWRSYFSQKLLHMVGERIAFYPTNAIQNRNVHDYHSDYKQEQQLYESSAKLVQYLDTWRCSAKKIATCTVDLAESLRERFWQRQDGLLVKLWIDDLISMGYEFPEMVDESENSQCKNQKKNEISVVQLEMNTDSPSNHSKPAIERAAQKLTYLEELHNWCQPQMGLRSMQPFSSTSSRHIALSHSKSPALVDALAKALIVLVEKSGSTMIGALQRLYQPYFAVVIFCGAINFVGNGTSVKTLSPYNYIRISNAYASGEYFLSKCVMEVDAMQLQNIKGYYAVRAAVVPKFWIKQPSDVALAVRAREGFAEAVWSSASTGKQAADKAVRLITEKHSSDVFVHNILSNYQKGLEMNSISANATAHMAASTGEYSTDFLYIPSAHVNYFSDLMRIFHRVHLSERYAIAKFLQTVPGAKFVA
ncbi:hypothetical protein Q1695_015509 [Nippostrongylus brasiliensis]|nr:hypothetical protein Q1695_015509 [Nippostrongylus brasiliensis]